MTVRAPCFSESPELCFRSMKATARFLGGLLLFALAQDVAAAQSKPEEVVFPSDGRELHGFLWKPQGPAPFPGIIWNHGSEKLPGSQPALASFYTAHSYVFFVPHRRGQGRSPGDHIQDLVAQAPPGERARRMVELQLAEVDDVIAALNYLKSQPFVDLVRIALSGCSYGGIQTLLAGERNLRIKALVPFAPGAMSWKQNEPLRDLLIAAVDRTQAPRLFASGGERLQPCSRPGLEQGGQQKSQGLSIKDLSGFRQVPSGWALGILLLGNRRVG
jgi:dienelactone hydrolase